MAFEDTEQAESHLVRLFPTMRISNNAEAETRATAALLAALRAVSEFGKTIVKIAGGPSGKITCYTEVPYTDRSQVPPVPLRPDGLLVVPARGGKRWRCFVEVKVGSNVIERQQIEKYIRLAKQEDIDALITISNEATINGLGFTKSELKGVELLHFSWDRLLSEARVLRGQGGVDDSDQQWILDEWIEYVSDPTSRIIDPPSLGPHFGDLLTAARENHLSGAILAVKDVCDHWDGFLKKASHRLRAHLGVDVHPGMTSAEKQSHDVRLSNLQALVQTDSKLAGSLKVKNAASEITIDVLLPQRAVRFGIEVKAPSTGKQLTRLKWITKQLPKAPPAARLHVHWDQRKLKSQARLSELDEELRCLCTDAHGQPIPTDAAPRYFTVEWTQDLQKAKGRSTAPILDGIMVDLEQFYRQVLEGILAFVPPAPKLPVVAVVEGSGQAAPTEHTEPDAPAESGEVATNVVPIAASASPRPSQPPPPDSPPQEPDRAVNE
jgi:hypothetical protein